MSTTARCPQTEANQTFGVTDQQALNMLLEEVSGHPAL